MKFNIEFLAMRYIVVLYVIMKVAEGELLGLVLLAVAPIAALVSETLSGWKL